MRRALASACLVALAGCATPYQAAGVMGGLSETWTAPYAVQVRFNGNGYTGSDRAQLYVMLRACELALQNGFTHVAVLGADGSVASTTYTTAPGRVSVAPDGTSATYTPPATQTWYSPSSGVSVILLTADEMTDPRAPASAIDARFFVERNAPADLRDRILSATPPAVPPPTP